MKVSEWGAHACCCTLRKDSLRCVVLCIVFCSDLVGGFQRCIFGVPSPPRVTPLLRYCCNGMISDSSLGKTPLHLCAEGWSEAYEGARALLEFGASPRVKDRRGRTPIDVAAKDEVEELLISWQGVFPLSQCVMPWCK